MDDNPTEDAEFSLSQEQKTSPAPEELPQDDPSALLATGIMQVSIQCWPPLSGSQLLQPVVLESDMRVQAVMKSQATLASEIDRLSNVPSVSLCAR